MKYQDYLDVNQAPDREAFDARLVKFAHAHDFEIISGSLVVEVPGKRQLCAAVGNTPRAYLDAAMSFVDGARDPVLRQLKSLTTPIIYDQSTYVGANAADLWEQQAVFGYHNGVGLALHMSEGRHFLLGMDRVRTLPKSDKALTRMMADLQLLAVYAQDAACRLLLPELTVEIPESASLTPREREVLRWTAEGKSSWVVGEILGLSESTVNFHLRNAMQKFNVSSKHQAALKALSAGLI